MPFLRIQTVPILENYQTLAVEGLRVRFVSRDPESGVALDISVWDTREHAESAPTLVDASDVATRVVEIEHIYVNELSHAFGLGRSLGVPLGRDTIGRGPRYRDPAPA